MEAEQSGAWARGWRERVWSEIETAWDLIIVGGGITGAGVFNAASRAGLRTLLVDANDFAYGTSSRSSKLVHGGLRYLRNRQFGVTCESVRERERLLHDAPELVEPLHFLLPCYAGAQTPCWQLSLGVLIYDLLAPKWAHGRYSRSELLRRCDLLAAEGLLEGCHYYDARVDDARLVLRILQEGVAAGGRALNYARAAGLLRTRAGQVCGVALEDRTPEGTGRTAEARAAVVINAAGPWADELRVAVGGAPRIRKLRGSHLLFKWERLPLREAVTVLHPRDNRALFVFPWEGVTLIGTTDLDHPPEVEAALPEPAITPGEVEYLLAAARQYFPGQELGAEDVVSTFAGLRPTIASSQSDPSKVSRAHVIWQEDGLLTVTGGKLTIYRRMAQQALDAVRARLPGAPRISPRLPAFLPDGAESPSPEIPAAVWRRLRGRYGAAAVAAAASASGAEELRPVPGLPGPWAELRWGARAEGVARLDDLLLRRTRLGLVAPRGGLDWMGTIREIAQPELGWDDARWEGEVERYARLWKTCYDIP